MSVFGVVTLILLPAVMILHGMPPATVLSISCLLVIAAYIIFTIGAG